MTAFGCVFGRAQPNGRAKLNKRSYLLYGCAASSFYSDINLSILIVQPSSRRCEKTLFGGWAFASLLGCVRWRTQYFLVGDEIEMAKEHRSASVLVYMVWVIRVN